MPTQKQVAEHLFMSVPAVSDFCGRASLDWRTLTMDELREAYIRHIRDVASARGSISGEYQLGEEKSRLAHHQANLAEIEERERRRELVPADAAQAVWVDMISAARAKLLALPVRLGGACAGMAAVDVEDAARRLITEALAELSGPDGEVVDDAGTD